MTVSHVDVGGRRLSYIRRGQGEPLLLVQGMSGHHDFWGDWFLELLEPHFDLVAFDNRGIATSDRADEPFSIADLADDAAGVIRGLGWDNAHVFGISLGGMIVQELTLRHPGLVRTLAIGCSWAGGPDGVIAEVSEGMVAAMATRNVEHALRVGFAGNVSESFAADPAHFETYSRLALAQKVPVPVVRMQFAAALRHNTVDRLPTIAAPTLVLHGTADAGIPSLNGEQLASRIPGARLELFDGVGHLFWWEEPERTAELLLANAKG
jgi:3-oxoadipate enol-lactonase